LLNVVVFSVIQVYQVGQVCQGILKTKVHCIFLEKLYKPEKLDELD